MLEAVVTVETAGEKIKQIGKGNCFWRVRLRWGEMEKH